MTFHRTWDFGYRPGETTFTDGTICDHCLTEPAARVAHEAPDGTKLFFCWDCRDRQPLSAMIADVCQRRAPLAENAHR